MIATTIRTLPTTGDYVPLSEYESQTPDSFVDGKAVLHHHISGAKASIPKEHAGKLAIFPSDATITENDAGDQVIEQDVEVFVNSENFTVFSNKAEAGVSIPYPSISIHAIKQVTAATEDSPATQAVWMQLDFSDGGAEDDDFQTNELTIAPPATASTDGDSAISPASQLYEAIASCSNLHPDPANGEEEEDEEENYDRIVFEGGAEHEAVEGFTGVMRGAADGGLPPPMPGSGGWITADNVHEYFDEEGNWIGPGAGEDGEDGEADELGEGAGRVRVRDEVENDGTNGHSQDDDAESKRPRID